MAERQRVDFKRHLPSWPFVAAAALVIGGVAGAVIYAGVYNIGADAPHMKPTYWLIENLRDRSIAVRARNIDVPADLSAPKRIATGAGLYAEMCSGCHLAPGMEKTELSQGLYPAAPLLAAHGGQHSPAEQFWTIKHGVKMTAMPAWGRTHSDELIWDMVAFIRTLPNMTPAQYKATVAAAPGGHDEMMADMPGMQPKEGEAAGHH
ncbi:MULTISPECIES: cytochrome c [unclassified Phenylobacterium]|jgi:mono/diheme cytochrome c family protein|uniref:c-type cytochrome n=1 Tax=unclassified Phenylobacterium TaxID=2640670 RepID=UPI00083B279F|nr:MULTISPECIES: cytochrome c [unclassified Phenylobacterium]